MMTYALPTYWHLHLYSELARATGRAMKPSIPPLSIQQVSIHLAYFFAESRILFTQV